MKEGFIYLLKSKNFTDKYYLGSCENPQLRIEQHNKGLNKSTATHKPWKCILVINVGSVQEARKIEYYIKKNKESLNIKTVIKLIHKYYNKLQYMGH